MHRREYLTLGGTTIATTVTGCVGSGTNKPDPDAPARDYLPEEGDGWEQTNTSEQHAGMVGAQDGVGGDYDYEGDYYAVEILRWGSEEDAEEGANNVYQDWTRAIAHGVFSFAANGPEGQKCEELLTRSPTVDEGMF